MRKTKNQPLRTWATTQSSESLSERDGKDFTFFVEGYIKPSASSASLPHCLASSSSFCRCLLIFFLLFRASLLFILSPSLQTLLSSSSSSSFVLLLTTSSNNSWMFLTRSSIVSSSFSIISSILSVPFPHFCDTPPRAPAFFKCSRLPRS